MNADEQTLIRGLFDRISAQGPVEKDADADALIRDGVAHNPNAPYLLVQSVLVQEQALQMADARIRELESKVADLEKKQVAAPAGRATGGFSGASSSVPAAGSGRSSSGFGAGASTASGTPRMAAANANSGHLRPGAAAEPQQQQPQRGGFMAQAMATAAGVAGGMLLASGISSLFSGDTATAAEGTDAAAGAESAAADQSQQPEAEQASAADAGNEASGAEDVQQADFAEDSGSGWGDFGDFGGDFEL